MFSPEHDDSIDNIDREYLETSRAIAEARANEELLIHPNTLLPKKALFQRYQNEMQQEFTSFRRRQTNGALKLAHSLQELARKQPELFTQDVIAEIGHIAALSDHIASDEMGYSEHIARGGSLQEFAGVSDSTMENLYQAAKWLYEQHLFTEAADAFFFLVGLNGQFPAFWLGLANAEFKRKNYRESIAAYSNAILATSYDPSIYIAISQCYEALDENDKAISTIDTGLAAIESNEEYANYKTTLETEKMRLQNSGNRRSGQ